jgi:hypothetical protein
MLVSPVYVVQPSGIAIPAPTLHFPCNESAGSNLLETIASLDMTQFNSPGATTGIVSGCRTFIRTTAHAFRRTVDDAAFQLASSQTIGLWVYLTTSVGLEYILARDVSTGGPGGGDYYLWFDSTGNALKFSYRYLTTNYYTITIASGLSTATWYCVGVKWDGTNLYASLNGAAWGGAVSAPNAPITDATNLNIVGANKVATASFGNLLNGRVDVLTYWKGLLLSDAEIAQFYNSGAGREYFSGAWH